MQLDESIIYIGPNRRSDQTVVEWALQLTPEELEHLRLAIPDCIHAMRDKLDDIGCRIPPILAEGGHMPGGSEMSLVADAGLWVAGIAIALQQAAGHRVYFTDVLPGRDSSQCRLVFEYEHFETGANAGELALSILNKSVPGLELELDSEIAKKSLKEASAMFLAEAGKHVLPLDTQAIIDAAARLDVPSAKLERPPYAVVEGHLRCRRNGLLRLGHSRYQRIVDGTLSIDRNPQAVPLLFDREKLFYLMSGLALPMAGQDQEFRNVITARRAVRCAKRLGYPVVLKPVKRSPEDRLPLGRGYTALSSDAEVEDAFRRMSEDRHQVIVEKYVTGSTVHLLMAGNEVVCVLDSFGSALPLPVLHPSISDMAIRIAETLKMGLLNITLVTQDLGRSLADTGGAVVNLDPAPQLDRLLVNEPGLMAEAAERFVRWLYPPGTPSRTPLIAVTGTNGKTTTSRMITRIMKTAGFSPGMASTSGVYINESLHKKGDLSGSRGHHKLFESFDVDLCVLETARGGIATGGFMFDWCDVAVCLNVTHDHIGEYDINTVEEMAVLKRSVLERARHAVVLNADYPTTSNMLPFAAGVRTYLASMESDEHVVRELLGGTAFACVLEVENGEEWIALYEPDGRRLPVMPVTAIPATLDGAARFNISNAQHAICACHAHGVDLEIMRQGLSGFDACFENTPGRMNIYRELPFTVIMDYVHNMDGWEKFCAFTDQMDVPGRRGLLLSLGLHRTDQEVADYTRLVKKHFDYFVCRYYSHREGREPHELPPLIRAILLEEGVQDDRITIVENPEDGVRTILELAQPGDLVVLMPATMEIDDMWQELISFEPRHLD